ncbi:MAG: antitoxin [Nocardioidaceae bacterium]|nr:antitoxin [Nocardioidaceae bacterium]
MGFFDRFKKQATDAADKASDLVGDHADQIDTGIDKAADLASKATKGKFDDRIDSAADAAKEQVDKIEKKEAGEV